MSKPRQVFSTKSSSFSGHWIAKKENGDDEESSYSSDEAESAYHSDDEHSDDEASQELQPLLLKLGKVVLDLHLKDNKRGQSSPRRTSSACLMN